MCLAWETQVIKTVTFYAETVARLVTFMRCLQGSQ